MEAKNKMKEKFVENGIEYVRNGDYYIPNLTVPDEKTYNIGKYGNLRKEFLKDYHQSFYTVLFMEGKLFEHLAEIDETCHNCLNDIIIAEKIICVKEKKYGHFNTVYRRIGNSGEPYLFSVQKA